jgi:hypothetical protein
MTDLHVAADQAIGREQVAVTGNCLPEHVSHVGGKAVGLGSLLRAGQRVPASFVVTAGAYREYRRGPTRELTRELRGAIAGAYAALCELDGTEVPVAIRSSATVEDSAEASWAGQFQTFPRGVRHRGGAGQGGGVLGRRARPARRCVPGWPSARPR